MRKTMFALGLVVTLLAAACGDDGASDAADTTSTAGEPVTLTLATYDESSSPSAQPLQAFVDQVHDLTDGSVTIEVTYEADDSDSPEAAVIGLVDAGDYDLGLTASRAFDLTGTTTFEALQTPFLIDRDDLAAAVATSDAATDMLADMGDDEVGLTLWPEDLRHPFSVVAGQAITSPDDLDGLDVRVPPSGVSNAVVEAMGGNPVYGDGDYQAGEAGFVNAGNLSGVPTGTGDVVLYPKYQVLYANAGAFDGLSDDQQAALREAAGSAQGQAIDGNPPEAQAAEDWCAANGSIALADDVSAFVDATQSVVDQIEADDGAHLDAVRAVVEDTDTGALPPVEACQASTADDGDDRDDEAWTPGLPPDGQWRATQTRQDFLNGGVSADEADGWAATVTVTFDGTEGLFDWNGEFDPDFACATTLEPTDEGSQMTYASLPDAPSPECEGVVEQLRWRQDGDTLVFDLVDVEVAPTVNDTVAWESHPFESVG